MPTTDTVDTLLRQRAQDKLNTKLDEVLAPAKDLISTRSGDIDSFETGVAQMVQNAIGSIRNEMYAALRPVYEAEEIAAFLASTGVESLVASS